MTRRIHLAGVMGTVLVVILLSGGCGGSGMGRVSGVVRLDGEPLPKATVEFQPKSGSPSYGVTDTNGRYELSYSFDTPGAETGQHVVRVTTYDWISDADGRKTEIPERVPAKYNTDSELQFEVKSGRQTIDIDLKSGN